LVLPLIGENKPKCFVCLDQFENMGELKNHQESSHKEIFEKYEKNNAKN
jgi:cysteine synthase